jgi:hypothetical protein
MTGPPLPPATAVAYLRTILAGDTEGQAAITNTTNPAELAEALAQLALTIAKVSFGDAIQVDLWLVATLYVNMQQEAMT